MQLMESENGVQKAKKLFVTCVSNDLEEFVLDELNIMKEQVLQIKSYGNVISQPFDSIIRNIILSVYQDNVDEVYIIGEQFAKYAKLEKEQILTQMNEDGITEKTIKTLEYLKQPIGKDLYYWLSGKEESVENQIIQSKNIIKNHPLIPNRIKVYALLVNSNEKKVVLV
ncbi:hypothetical protein [Salipaludibacillus daqingensis]|uniref:hypothetical protein n=1 Tax=Salipaludibacillus daqingensis TaxID=3041001 RepID=UPI002474BFDC|nr:hypothetical protein [Salipaludibacillus daqingensis]